MKKIFFYLLGIILGAFGALSVLRGIELLATGGLSAYGAGRLTGSLVLGLLLLFGAWKAITRARAI